MAHMIYNYSKICRVKPAQVPSPSKLPNLYKTIYTNISDDDTAKLFPRQFLFAFLENCSSFVGFSIDRLFHLA